MLPFAAIIIFTKSYIYSNGSMSTTMKNTLHIKRIEDVLEALEHIIDYSQRNNDPGGYFAALYYKVTDRVKAGIQDNFFDDGERMEALDVIFAKRYIDAWIAWKNNAPLTKSWFVAFEASKRYRPVVLQHLLLGMNAHINLDLGISAAQVMQGLNPAPLHRDFNKINSILSSLVHEVQNDLTNIWPTLAKILHLAGKTDDFLVDFSMKLARDGAWKFANEMALARSGHIKSLIELRDEKIARKAQIVLNPGFIASAIFFIVRLGEKGSANQKIEWLKQK
jgi:hypothetical protein